MRIAHVSYGTMYGGAPELIRADSKGFQELGCEVSWFDIAPYFYDQPLGDYLHDVMHGIRPQIIPGGDEELRKRYVSPDANFAPLVAAIKADRPDIVILHDPIGLILAPELSGEFPLVWRSHIGDQTWNEWTMSASRIIQPALEKCAYAVVHLPEYIWPDPPCPFVVSSPGIDVDSLKNRDLSAAQTARLDGLLTTGVIREPWPDDPASGAGLDDRRPLRLFEDHGTGFLPSETARYAVVIARWDPLKGHRLALDGFAGFADTDPELHFVFVGPNLYPTSRNRFLDVRGGILSAIDALPARMKRRFHAWSAIDINAEVHQAAVNLIRTRATCVVQPSLREGFGLSVTESMYRRSNVIATKVGGHRHQFEHGVNGLLCEPRPEALADALASVVRNRLDLGTAARTSVTARFTARISAGRQLGQLAAVAR